MSLNLELASMLNSFLQGELQLPAYREAMLRLRLEKLDSLEPSDKTFVYGFETRYAQLKAGALTDTQFKDMLSYAAASIAASQNPQPDVWFEQSEQQADRETPSGVPKSKWEQRMEVVAVA